MGDQCCTGQDFCPLMWDCPDAPVSVRNRALDEEAVRKASFVPVASIKRTLMPNGDRIPVGQANRLEALCVEVWSHGGPEAYDKRPARKEHELAKPVATCIFGGHPMYEQPKLCGDCGTVGCSEHGEVLAGQYFCSACVRRMREV